MQGVFTIYTILGCGFWGYILFKLLMDNTISRKNIMWMIVFVPHTTIVVALAALVYSRYPAKKS